MFDAAERYQQAGLPLIILAGKEYGSGSSRDWAAKGPFLLVSRTQDIPAGNYPSDPERKLGGARKKFLCFTFQEDVVEEQSKIRKAWGVYSSPALWWDWIYSLSEG